MSAFIVNNKTINKALTYLKDNRNGDWINRKFEKIGFNVKDKEDLDRLGRAMLLLNIEAVNQRYNEQNNSTALLENYSFKIEFCNRYQALKSLQCWRYQCSEGNVPETDFYKLMDKVINSWLDEIVSDLPEYKKAEWSL